MIRVRAEVNRTSGAHKDIQIAVDQHDGRITLQTADIDRLVSFAANCEPARPQADIRRTVTGPDDNQLLSRELRADRALRQDGIAPAVQGTETGERLAGRIKVKVRRIAADLRRTGIYRLPSYRSNRLP